MPHLGGPTCRPPPERVVKNRWTRTGNGDPDEYLWARYYSLDDNTPVFCNRDGIRVPKLADVHLERRTGYAWYGIWPRKTLEEDYPTWQKRLK